jgi:pteridine reductase
MGLISNFGEPFVPVALVTGGAKRIGAAIVRQLHGMGYTMVVHYHHSHDEAHALIDSLNGLRDNSAIAFSASMGDSAALAGMVEKIINQCGRLDALINNASSFYPTPIGSINIADWENQIDSNLKGPLFLSQAAAPWLTKTHGCIVNIVDIHAERPMRNYPIYSSAKAGLVALTKALALELAPQVRVNAVAPGAILFPESQFSSADQLAIINHTMLKRQGSPEDVARTVAFLVAEAPYLTAQVIAVDGGRGAMLE